MINNHSICAIALFMIQICFLGSTDARSLPQHESQESDVGNKLTYQGHLYFNATKSGLQGEKYLLNQQISNLKLFLQQRLSPWGELKALAIYNKLPTPLTPRFYFEQFYLTFKSPQETKWYLEMGRKWVPFGSYQNDLIYKPLTKALGQTNEYTFIVGYHHCYNLSISLFSPHSRIQSSSLPAYYNINTGIHHDGYDLGISYLYSIADSQLFQFNKGFGGFLYKKIDSRVSGLAGYLNLRYQKFNTYLTYVSAVNAFKTYEVSYQNKGAIPKALSIQNGYEFNLQHKPAKIIIFYDHSFQALALKLPQKRFGAGFNIYPMSYLDVQFQAFKDYSYPKNVVASGLNKKVLGNSKIANTFALQLVFNF